MRRWIEFRLGGLIDDQVVVLQLIKKERRTTTGGRAEPSSTFRVQPAPTPGSSNLPACFYGYKFLCRRGRGYKSLCKTASGFLKGWASEVESSDAFIGVARIVVCRVEPRP
jgi:hypothetical protein